MGFADLQSTLKISDLMKKRYSGAKQTTEIPLIFTFYGVYFSAFTSVKPSSIPLALSVCSSAGRLSKDPPV